MIPARVRKALESWAPRWRPFRFKATLIAMVVLAIVIPLGVLAIPYLELFNDMAVQPKGKPQGQYGWFSGQALTVERPPVEGTMPMEGWEPYRLDVPEDPEDPAVAAKRAGELFPNPEPRTLEVLLRGKKHYNVFCITCHGMRGEGNGKLAGTGLFAVPTLHTEDARGFKDGRIYHVITKGYGDMPSYADRLEPHERWSVVHYVRALQREMQRGQDDEGDGR
jgi:mono/diheme cytochrome c family protein